MNKLQIHLRPPDLTDKNFIFNSWLKSYRTSEFAKSQCNEVYYSNYKLIVEKLLKKSKILVACNPQDYMQVYGYIIYEELAHSYILVHYVYTKYTYRKFGVAKSLLNHIKISDNPIISSHFTKPIEEIQKKMPVLYDPYRGIL